MKLLIIMTAFFTGCFGKINGQEKRLMPELQKQMAIDLNVISQYSNWQVLMEITNDFESYYELKSMSQDTVIRVNLTNINGGKFSIELFEKFISKSDTTTVLGYADSSELQYHYIYRGDRVDEKQFVFGFDYYRRKYK